MRVPVEWLTQYADPGLPVSALEERLTMTGTKVEAVHHHGVDALERFVIGRVLEAGRHPDADRLSVCMVDVGDGGPQQIVCGAPNVAAGQIVAVARPGAVMPDGTRLGVAKLRGVESNGMILAEDELAIGTEHAGIMVLDDGLEPGTPLAGVLPIATDVLELEVTPNRPDCLAVDEDITLADLKGTLLAFARAVFGEDREVRLRPHFFPFTEPSVEVDVSCFQCGGTGYLPDGSRCSICRGEGWLEILGAGEVDPNVYAYVDDDRYDPEKVQGFAWGLGIERVAMLKHGITDLRMYYDNDLRFLEQFG